MKSADNFDILKGNFQCRDRKLKHFKEAEQGDSFVIAETAEKIKLTASLKNLSILFFTVLAIFLVIFGRLFYLQIFQGAYFRLQTEGNRLKVERLKALRGIIYDRQGRPLVKNNPNFSLLLLPNNLPPESEAKEAIAQNISSVLKIPAANLLEIFNKDFHKTSAPQLLADKINYEQALTLDVQIARQPCLVLEVGLERQYLGDNMSLAHIMGYVGQITETEWATKSEQNYQFNDFIGKSGLESWYEEILRGSDGFRQIEVDAKGEKRKIVQEKPPQAGEDLYVSIIPELQTETSRILKKYGVKKGAVVALDPRNGEVLTLLSAPLYDNNLFSGSVGNVQLKEIFQDPLQPLFNRAIMAQYPSGSTFKPVVAVAALAEAVITESTRVFSNGGLQINQWFFPDWKAGGHGWVNVETALAESVNTFFYYIGGGFADFKGLGVERLVNYARKFGLGEEFGIDLPGEKPGFLPSMEWKEKTKGEAWYIGDTYHLAIGQGDILVTPLQVAAYMAAIVNGGVLYQPHLVTKITNPQAGTEIEINGKILNSDIVKESDLEVVKKGLRLAVTAGSAKGLAGLPVKVGAKTGTAQVGGVEQPHAWLAVFGPYDQPQIVLIVVVENGGEGSLVALPIARDILNWFFQQQKLTADLN